MVLDQLRRVDLEVCAKYIRAIEVRRCVGITQSVGVVAGEEQADVALLVERVAPGIAGSALNVIGEAFFQMSFKCVICRIADCLEEDGIRVSQVMNSK